MLDTMKKLDETGQRILFIAPEGKLKAVVTDGDIRKCILRGGALSAPLTQAANYHPHSLPVAVLASRTRAERSGLASIQASSRDNDTPLFSAMAVRDVPAMMSSHTASTP